MYRPAIAIVATLGLAQLASAATPPLMVVSCAASKGVNIAAFIESERPRTEPAAIFDAEAGAYVSHPHNSGRWTLTVNRDGTATETDFSNDGTSLVSDLRFLGKDENTMSFVLIAGGTANMITLYPKDSVAIVAATVYFGWKRAVPTGSVYISHCDFSHVLN
jgi:hypothetical protein